VSDERWRRVKALFQGAVERPAAERAASLAAAAGDDEALRREVESLLAADVSDASFLDRLPVASASVLADPLTSPGASGNATLTSAALAPGRRVGPYEIVAPLGSGGMGEVYRARDTRLDRDVAIKVLPAPFAADADRLRRFEAEARAIAALNHPHICQLHDIGPGYLVLEYIEGEPLHGPMAVEPAWRLALQIVSALEAAHRRGILHRDLKPANIMVTPEGMAKLLDFGLAKLMNLDADVTRTQDGTVVGTAGYMSPEQAQGQSLDARSDVFSFGAVLYEMLSGTRAFGGGSTAEVLSAVLRDEPRPIQAPPALERIVRRCLAKQPGQRFQTMGELKMALERADLDELASKHAEHLSSIAVLSFTDMSAAKDQDWFCDGIAEEILNALTPLKGLRVAARTSAFAFKGKSDDVRSIGQQLNVMTVLEGSVRRAGDRVRITAQLSDVQNGFQLWSERYDRELKDIFDVQDEIARAIAERLRVTLAGGKDFRLVEQGTKNVEAYQLYLKGHALLGRRGASIPAALDLFRKAVEIDPSYSLAWASIADALTGLAITGSVSGSESKRQAMAAAMRSIELDPGSAAGHTALACATLLYENNRTRARQEFERALDLNPNYALGRCWYALFYLQWACGELDRGIAEARRALDIDPQSSYLSMILACCLCTAGRLDEAIETARQAVEQDPESSVARWILGVSLRTAGRFEEAVSTLEAAAAMSGRYARGLTSLAGVFGQWGKPSEASALHHELMDRAKRAFVPLTYLVVTAEAAGQHEEAIAFARRAWDEREPTFILHALHFPEFRTLRSDPRFAAILREMDSA
jgi:serine/threonine-protein kinase